MKLLQDVLKHLQYFLRKYVRYVTKDELDRFEEKISNILQISCQVGQIGIRPGKKFRIRPDPDQQNCFLNQNAADCIMFAAQDPYAETFDEDEEILRKPRKPREPKPPKEQKPPKEKKPPK
jgi:hypothetical protein